MREATDQRDELDLLVAQVLLTIAGAVVAGPALVLAVPLAFVIVSGGGVGGRGSSPAPSPPPASSCSGDGRRTGRRGPSCGR